MCIWIISYQVSVTMHTREKVVSLEQIREALPQVTEFLAQIKALMPKLILKITAIQNDTERKQASTLLFEEDIINKIKCKVGEEVKKIMLERIKECCKRLNLLVPPGKKLSLDKETITETLKQLLEQLEPPTTYNKQPNQDKIIRIYHDMWSIVWRAVPQLQLATLQPVWGCELFSARR
jgi:hypothetical protein